MAPASTSVGQPPPGGRRLCRPAAHAEAVPAPGSRLPRPSPGLQRPCRLGLHRGQLHLASPAPPPRCQQHGQTDRVPTAAQSCPAPTPSQCCRSKTAAEKYCRNHSPATTAGPGCAAPASCPPPCRASPAPAAPATRAGPAAPSPQPTCSASRAPGAQLPAAW